MCYYNLSSRELLVEFAPSSKVTLKILEAIRTTLRASCSTHLIQVNTRREIFFPTGHFLLCTNRDFRIRKESSRKNVHSTAGRVA